MAVYTDISEIELAEFLRSRRERITPEQAGLPPAPRRRTPGLRREEVAQLAGVGVTWYTWLEQGRPINVSTQVLDAIARTLELDPAEHRHLYVLAQVPDVAPAAGDLTALPAMARIAEQVTDRPVRIWAETQEVPGYFATDPTDPVDTEVTWIPAAGGSRLAALVETIEWPDGPGYFWMAGESAQMRQIRRHLRHDLGMPSSAYDVMGYWSGTRGRQVRAVDPRPIYEAGRAAGKSDEEIWADYDAAGGQR